MSSNKRTHKPRKREQAVAVAQHFQIKEGGVVPDARGWIVATEEPGICILFGNESSSTNIDFGKFEEFPLMPQDARQTLSQGIAFPLAPDPMPGTHGQAIEQFLPAANLIAQVAQGAYQAQGLVRLSPETLTMIQSGAKTLQAGGWNIGALSGPGGQFVGTVQWLPAGAAVPLAVAASAGVALTLIALQWQLSRIEKQTQQALKFAGEILQEIRADQRNDVAARVKRLRDAMNEAKAAGAVTNAVWEGLSPEVENQLGRLRSNAEDRVDRLIADLNRSSSAKERGEWMNANGGVLVQDIMTLIEAFGGLYRYWVLRVARNLRTPGGDDSDAAVAETVKANARRDLVVMREKLAPRIEELWRYFSLIWECPGSLGMAVWGRGKTIREVREAARQLREALGELHERFVGYKLQEPSAIASMEEALAPLRWLLRRNEEVHLSFDLSPLFCSERTVVATSQRLFILRRSSFLKTGLVDEVRENSEIHYKFDKENGLMRMRINDISGGECAKPIHTILFRKEDFPAGEVNELLSALQNAREQRADTHPTADVLSKATKTGTE
jgi:hypothetical protein